MYKHLKRNITTTVLKCVVFNCKPTQLDSRIIWVWATKFVFFSHLSFSSHLHLFPLNPSSLAKSCIQNEAHITRIFTNLQSSNLFVMKNLDRYIYIYIYIYRERERERDAARKWIQACQLYNFFSIIGQKPKLIRDGGITTLNSLTKNR